MKPTDERLRASEWFVGDCDIDRASAIVRRYHYAAGTSNTGTSIHGLYRESDCWLGGVSWWLPPLPGSANATWPEDPAAVLALSRLVILPEVPKNAATFLLSRSAKLVPRKWICLVTYADTWRGHTGHIYKAAGWEELGLTKPEAIYTINGRVVSRKAGPKTRTHAQMLALGATFEGKHPRYKFRLVRKPARAIAPLMTQSQLCFDEQ